MVTLKLTDFDFQYIHRVLGNNLLDVSVTDDPNGYRIYNRLNRYYERNFTEERIEDGPGELNN